MTHAAATTAQLEAVQKFHAANPELYQERADGLDLAKLADDLMAEAMRRAKSAVATGGRFVSEQDPEALAAVKHEGALLYLAPTNLLLFSPDVYADLHGGTDILKLHDLTMELLSLVAFATPDRVDDCLGRYAEAIEIYQLDA